MPIHCIVTTSDYLNHRMRNYDKAEPAFVELEFSWHPKDYHSYAKLIQIYYYRKDYEKAQSYSKINCMKRIKGMDLS